VRTSTFVRNASGVAFVVLLAGCSGGNSQTPAFSGSANPLGQKSVQSTSHGFMQDIAAQTKLMYMSSWGTASVVDVMTMSGELVGQITNGLLEPQGIFVDPSGKLWVANVSNVLVYPRGGLSPSKTLTDSIGPPVDVSVCPNGTAYVADLYDNSNTNVASIQVYPPGSTSPSGSLTYTSDTRNPFLTCDAAGNVFAAILTGNYEGDGRVIEFPLGQESGAKDLGISLESVGGIKPDNAGNLLVTDLVAHTISEYTESGSPTGKSFATGNPIEGIALSRDGKTVLGASPNGPSGITWSYPGGKQLKVYTCCSRIGPPLQNNYGVAFDPGQKGI
jgi:serine/threonine-protein kinase